MYNNTHNTYKNESKHSEMGPVRQNPIQGGEGGLVGWLGFNGTFNTE